MTCERGNVFHPLVAFIVDQYLSRNQFFQTRAIFRNEASSLFANSSTNENLLSLEEMLNQYVFMKQQNIVLEKEKVMVMQEKNRIQMLLQNMQNALDSFHARSSLSNAATIITNSTIVPPMQSSNRSSPVVASTSTVFPMQNTLSLLPIPVDNVSLLSPMIRVLDKKRKDTPIVDGFIVAKKPRDRPLDQKNKFQGIKILLPSPNDKVDFGSNSATAQLVGNCALGESHISTNSFQCSDVSLPTEISTNRVMVETVKQMVYKEDNHDIFPIKTYSDKSNKENTNETREI